MPGALAGGVPARGDLVDFFWPMKSYTAERWRSGAPPLWNPLSGCGEPWLAQLQTGVAYPGDLPFLLRWPLGAHAGIALHVVIAAAGMAAWLWSLGTSRAGALAGAAVYAGGGGFLSLFPVYNNAATAAWLPWVFLGARRAVERGSPASFALPAALAFLAGEPALAAAGCLAAAGAAFVSRGEGSLAPAPKASGAVLRIAAAALLAGGLASVAALPFVEHVVRTDRRATIPRSEAMARPLGAGELADLLLPPTAEATRTADLSRGGYLATLALGPAALLLAAAGGAGFPGRPRLLASLAAVAALGLLASLGERGLLAPALFDAGLLRGVRYPARWFVFVQLFLALLAGAGLDGWVHGNAGGRPARIAAGAVAAGTLLLVLPLLSTPSVRASRDAGRAAVVALAAACVAGVVLAARRGRRGVRPGLARALLASAVAVPVPIVAADPLAQVDASSLVSRAREAFGLRRGDREPRAFVAAADPSLLALWTLRGEARWTEEVPRRAVRALAGYANLREGIPTAGTASPVDDPRRVRLLGAALSGGDASGILQLADVGRVITPFPSRLPGASLAGGEGGVRLYQLPEPAGRAFFARSVRVADDDTVFRELSRGRFVPDAVAWVAPRPSPAPSVSTGRGYGVARVTADEPERLEASVSASAPSFLVLTRSYHPGWRASLDGREVPLHRVDLAFQGIEVPPGDHRLELRFRPVSHVVGAAVSGVSLVVLLALWLGGPSRRGEEP